MIDEAHHNFHTAEGRYAPFAKLLRRDGYRVEAWRTPFGALRGVDVLVISNALHKRNEKDWSLPTPSAFTTEEIGVVRSWVESGVTGSAFRPPPGAQPLLVFGSGLVSRMPQEAWKFTAQTPSADIEGWCQGALLERGKGRVAVFGEAGMFTAQFQGRERRPMGMNVPEASENARFLLNVMSWLARADGGATAP